MDTASSPPEAAPIRGGRLGAAVAGACAVLGLALVAITLVGRLDRAPGVPLLYALFALPWLWGAWCAGVFGAWCAFPDRRALPALGVVGLGVMGAQWGPSLARWAEPATGEPLTVMTWNLRRLWGGPGDGGDALQCAPRTLRQADPDLLVLTEVSREDLAALEPALGLSCAHGTYLSGGSERRGGLAACGRGPWTLSASEVVRFDDARNWRYVLAELVRTDRPSSRINLLAVHLSPFRKDVGRSAQGQADQAAALLGRVERLRDPTVLAGDFNSTRDFALHAALRGRLTDVWERGGVGAGATRHLGGWLPLRIDFVYASPAFGVGGARVLGEGCSDHLPVVGELFLRDPG